MTEILKRKLKQLAGDESGVAFAFTVTVSLIIFLFGFAVYAVGETVRERLELQNAADAAAYSGALVQADTISRIAVINKAMAWNYAMMTRRQMDHIVDVFLAKVTEQWNQACTATSMYQRICACHMHIEGFNWRVGVMPGGGGGEVTHRLVRLNCSQDVLIPVITAARAANAVRNPVMFLESLRNCITSMNKAESDLISGMKKRIEHAVEFAVDTNVSLTGNDRKAGSNRKIKWSLHELKDASSYFEILSRDESRFLHFGDFPGGPETVFQAGASTWLPQKGTEGFQRSYVQTATALQAMWYTYNQIWVHAKVCVFSGLIVKPGTPVTGSMAYDKYYMGIAAKPRVLKPNYFDPDGAVVVGVSRPLNNPFAFIFGGGDRSGIYSAFNTGGGKQTMWALAAARAGYRLPSWKEGEYRNRGSISSQDNLCVTDWDAEFLPSGEEAQQRSGMLHQLADKLDATADFVGRNHTSSYSKIDFSTAGKHLFH